MSVYYIKLSFNNNMFRILLSPFTEKDIFKIFNAESLIEIKNAYIQVFGKNINSDISLTEENFRNFNRLYHLNMLFATPLEYSINDLEMRIIECNLNVCIKDEIITIIDGNGNHQAILEKICSFLTNNNYTDLLAIISRNVDHYICFSINTLSQLEFEIFENFGEMQNKSTLLRNNN